LSFEKVFPKVVKFISLRPRSQKEILNYLAKKSSNQKIKDKVLQELTNLGLIDDQAFVHWWVDQRNTFRPKGKRALMMELRQKGIDRDLSETIINQEVDEKKLAKALILKKRKFWEKLPLEKQKEKMAGFLARRGFSWPTIEALLDENRQMQ
jgi:regulatory protein